MPENHPSEPHCLVCNRTGKQTPLITLEYRNRQFWICPQHLPVLIHDPKWLDEARKEAARYLDGIAAPLREAGMRVRTILDERPPADAILHVATREAVDLIVMSTHGRGGLSRMLMGSVAESVFRATSRTVMLVKPEPSYS